MKILVIDDSRGNLESAKLTLANHELTLCQTVIEAYKQLKDNTFDAVLTDLHMPLGEFNGLMTPGSHKSDGTLPVGLVFAIKAANKGIPAVICTDSDHHQDWTCTLLDLLGYANWSINDSEQKFGFVSAGCCTVDGYWDETIQAIVKCPWEERKDKPVMKNWLSAMGWSGLFPELFPNRS